MIGIEIEGKKADLYPGTSISLNLVNPLFNDDNIIPGDYSLPFTLPSAEESPLNAEIFGHHDVVESQQAFRKKDARLFFDNVLLRTGKIWNREAAGKISSNFTFGLNTISEDFKTKKLRELMDEEFVIDATAYTKKVYITIGSVWSENLYITINKRKYTGTSTYDVSSLITAINADTTEPRVTATYIYDVAGDYFGIPNADVIELKPYTDATNLNSPLHVDFDNDNGTEGNYKWLVKGFDQVEADYWEVFNTFFESYMTADPDTDKFRIPLRFNTFFGVNPYFQGDSLFLANMATTANGGLFFNTSEGNIPFRVVNRNTLQPFVMMKYIFEKAAAYFGFEVESDWLDDADVQEMLIDNAAPLIIKMPFIGKSDFVFWKRSFNLKDLVPDITFVDLLKALQNRYNLKVEYKANANKLIIKRRQALAESTTRVNVDSAARGIPKIKDLSLTGIRFESDQDKDDQLSVTDFIDVGTPEGTPIRTALSGLQDMTIIGMSATVKKQDYKSDFALRVFYYKGINGAGTPYALSNAAGWDETWAGENGLYETFWKRWAWQQMRRKAVEIELDWGLAELQSLDREVKLQYDRNDYFLYSLEVPLTMQGISPMKATLYRC